MTQHTLLSLVFRVLLGFTGLKMGDGLAVTKDNSFIYSVAKVASEVTPHYPINPLAIWTGKNFFAFPLVLLDVNHKCVL